MAQVLHPSGMKHMIVRVSIQRGNVAGFNLERRDGTPFTERELALVDLVAPFLHIAEVLTLTEQKACVSAEFRREHRLTEREGDFVWLNGAPHSASVQHRRTSVRPWPRFSV